MAGPSNSPAFNPPQNHTTDDSPDIVRVDLTKVEIGFRASQQKGLMDHNVGTVRNLKNGQ